MGLFRTLCHRALHGTFNGFHRGKKGAKDNFFFYECMLEVKREMYPHTETEFSRRFFQNLRVPHQSRKYGIFKKKKGRKCKRSLGSSLSTFRTISLSEFAPMWQSNMIQTSLIDSYKLLLL